MILCFDGGGSSSRMLLVDDSYNVLGEAHATSVNQIHTPLPEIEKNLSMCLDSTLNGQKLTKDDEVVISMAGPVHILESMLSSYGCSICCINESQAALWANMMHPNCYVASSGTGSFVSYINIDYTKSITVGGLGYLLGDEGSGFWIGQRALRAVGHDIDGTGAPTDLTLRANEFFGIITKSDLIMKIYSAASCASHIAAFVPEVAVSARLGDDIALSIFREAGEQMSHLLISLINKTHIHNSECLLSGGVWKAHKSMYDRFSEKVYQHAPEITIKKPYFEPVLAGIVQKLTMQNPTWTIEERIQFLTDRFPGYVINMD